MSNELYKIIKRPLITEKTNELRDEANAYTFEVSTTANKISIKQAVESLFGVHVKSVRTLIVRGQMRRGRRGIGKQPNWKKAIVTLYEGESIELFSGL